MAARTETPAVSKEGKKMLYDLKIQGQNGPLEFIGLIYEEMVNLRACCYNEATRCGRKEAITTYEHDTGNVVSVLET